MATQITSQNRSFELKKLKAVCVAEENHKYIISQRKRVHGKTLADSANSKLKATPCDVFIYIIGQDAEAKNLQEQFKTTRSYNKTKIFADPQTFKKYLDNVKYPPCAIIITIYIQSDDATEEMLDADFSILTKIKQEDPSMDLILLSTVSTHAQRFDSMVLKNSEMLGKFITTITWAIREQNRIRKQVEAKQLIKVGIIVFVSAIVLIFVIDFVTGMLSPVKQGILGILPIPQ